MTDFLQEFRSRHDEGNFLLLGNAWDCLSARVWENAGASVIGTSSSAIAWANGASDGQKLGWDRMLQVIMGIARHVNIPVSADIENGFSADPGEVAHRVLALKEAGIVGINLEDGAADATLHRAKIESTAIKIRAIRDLEGVDKTPIFINARTDLFLLNDEHTKAGIRAAIDIAHLYEKAGADCFFAPGLVDMDLIACLTKGSPLPVNIYALPGLAGRDRLSGLGVRRLSIGCAPLQNAIKHLSEQAGAYLAGEADPFSDNMTPYPDAVKIAASAKATE